MRCSLTGRFTCAVAVSTIALAAATATDGGCVTSNNYVEIHLERVNDFEQVETAFEVEINVVIPDTADVASRRQPCHPR